MNHVCGLAEDKKQHLLTHVTIVTHVTHAALTATTTGLSRTAFAPRLKSTNANTCQRPDRFGHRPSPGRNPTK